MTRINLVPPAELYDQHLFAEFREIKMIPKSLARSLRAAERQNPSDPVAFLLTRIPKEFTLNTGHVSFFYDKAIYLNLRYQMLRLELYNRGVNYDVSSVLDSDNVFGLDERFQNHYRPTPEALNLIRERIASRVAMKPQWYRMSPRRIGGSAALAAAVAADHPTL